MSTELAGGGGEAVRARCVVGVLLGRFGCFGYVRRGRVVTRPIPFWSVVCIVSVFFIID